MEYISAKETAEKWAISPTRVVILAKSGRIPGAHQMGRQWLIPAAAKKPADSRRKKASQSGDEFLFPFFLYQFHADHRERDVLPPEGQRLYDAQLCFVRGDLDTAAAALDNIIRETVNRYLLIGALVTRGFVSIELGQIPQYQTCLQRLRFLFSEDFPHREELRYFFYDLRSYAIGNEQWAADFRIQPDSAFHGGTASYLITNIAYASLIKLAFHNTQTDASLLELSCLVLRDKGIYFSEQMVHVFLSGIYLLQGEMDLFRFHLQAVVDMAIEHDSYYPLAVVSRFHGHAYDNMLADYPPEVSAKIISRCEGFNSGVDELHRFFSRYTDSPQLSQRDYEYILFAIQGFTNKELARKKGLSEPTVSKRYSELYQKFDVKNKRELVEYFRLNILSK